MAREQLSKKQKMRLKLNDKYLGKILALDVRPKEEKGLREQRGVEWLVDNYND